MNRFGSAAAAGSAVAMTFEYFAYYAITSLGQSATTFISQNYAANNFDRCRKYAEDLPASVVRVVRGNDRPP